MKNQYNLKDKKAQIYREVEQRTPGGSSEVEGYYPRAETTLWCYTRQLTQDQIFAAMAYSQQEARFFVFNYYTGVEVYDVIQYQGKWYEATRVDTTDGYKGDLFIYVQLYRKSTPKPEQIKAYDPNKWE